MSLETTASCRKLSLPQVRTFFGKVGRHIQRLRLHKLTAWRTITAGTIPLKPGVWWVDAEFSRHWKSLRLPLPLRGAKSWGQWHPLLVRLAYGIAAAIVPPWFARMQSQTAESEASFEILLVGTKLNVAAISASGARVIRLVPASEVTRLIQLRQEIQTVYPCAQFHLGGYVPGGSVALIHEELVEAPVFMRVDSARQLAVVARVFEFLAEAPAVTTGAPERSEWSRRARLLASEYMPSEMGAGLGSAIDDVARSCKVCWTHGDMHGRNILVGEADVRLVDLDYVSPRPAFCDPINLMFTEANERGETHLDAYFRGHFDLAMQRLGVLWAEKPTPCERCIAR